MMVEGTVILTKIVVVIIALMIKVWHGTLVVMVKTGMTGRGHWDEAVFVLEVDVVGALSGVVATGTAASSLRGNSVERSVRTFPVNPIITRKMFLNH